MCEQNSNIGKLQKNNSFNFIQGSIASVQDESRRIEIFGSTPAFNPRSLPPNRIDVRENMYNPFCSPYLLYPQYFVPPHISYPSNRDPRLLPCTRERNDEYFNKVIDGIKPKNKEVFSRKLWEVKENFLNLFQLLKTIREEVELVESNVGLLDSESWHCWQSRIHSFKENVMNLKKSLSMDSTSLIYLKHKTNLRKKKRRLMRNKKASVRNLPSKYIIADMHMQKLTENVLKMKQEERLKEEADSVLSLVKQKKNEANYQIQLLKALQKLQRARIQVAANSTNERSLNASAEGFAKIVDKLESLWKSKLEEYAIEENGLRVMLKDVVANAEDEDCTKLKKHFAAWYKLFFGRTNLEDEDSCATFDKLIQNRKRWDKFVSPNKSLDSSNIPIGWVIPICHDDDSWSGFLAKN